MAVFTAIGAAVFGAGTFLAGVTAAGLQIAAGVAVSLIGKAISGDQQATQQRFGVQGRIQGGDAVPRSIIFGYASTAGSYVWGNTWGTASGVPNAYLTQVIALADYPIRALTGIIANDLPATFAATTHPQYGRPILEYRKNGVDHMWVKFYDGTQTTADTFLTGTVASAERPYGSNRVGRGVPYAIVTCMAPERKDGEEAPLFQNGLPKFKFVVEGSKLYDPTRDSTAGGSGAQRFATPSTWGGDGDFLPVVQVYNLMRGIRYNGGWLYGLQSLPAARLPTASWVNEIAKCRASITGPAGAEPTYRTGGEVQVGAQIRLAIEAMLTGCQGRLTEVGGSYRPFVGEPNAPVYSFSDGDIISTEDQTFTPFYGLEDTINGIQATYPNPNEGWNDKTAPPLLRTDLEVLDGNRRLLANVSLDMVPYGGQVQRLMQSALREAQRARRHTITMGPEFWVLEPGDYITWNSARNGYIDKLFRVDGIADQPDLNVLLDITEVDPSDYDWNQAADFRPVVDGPLQLVGTPALPAIGWQVYGAIVLDQLGRERRPGIEVAYQSGLQNVEHVRIQVRNVGATLPFIDVLSAYGSPWRTQISGNFPPNATYEVRGIYVLVGNASAEWSDWLTVTTPDVQLIAGLDFDPYGEVDLEDISASFDGLLRWMNEGLREVVEDAQALAVRAAEQDLGQQITIGALRSEASTTAGLLTADYTNRVTVLTGYVDGQFVAYSGRLEELETTLDTTVASAIDLLETQITSVDDRVTAQANAVTALSTVVGPNSSTAALRIGTVATEAGASATIGLSVGTSVTGVANAASLFLSAVGGISRVSVQADQFIVRSSASPATPFIVDSGGLKVATALVRDLTAANITANSITADRLNVTALSALSANLGTVTAGTISLAAGKLVIDGPNSRILVSD